ncbi:MAG TPA: hypothetical protein VKV19_00440 [Ktedonobacteraceae bacterium]|jgi:hypothetical protein|nr:hypothetical protein [Ktedonobacteraceae bacterium]
MSFQICIKTEKSLHQLATEIRKLLSLPPFQETAFSGEPYCQFEMLGMLILIHQVDKEERDPEVKQYPYSFDLQLSFSDHELDTDSMEYHLQPYYAQLLSFQLGIETAYREQKKGEHGWQIRYRFCRKNPRWNSNILFGEPGWQPAVIEAQPSQWRSMQAIF